VNLVKQKEKKANTKTHYIKLKRDKNN